MVPERDWKYYFTDKNPRLYYSVPIGDDVKSEVFTHLSTDQLLQLEPKANQAQFNGSSDQIWHAPDQSGCTKRFTDSSKGLATTDDYRSTGGQTQDTPKLDPNDIFFYEPVEHPVEKSDSDYTLEDALFNFFRSSQIDSGFYCKH